MAVDFSSDVDLISVTVPGQANIITIQVPGIQGPPGKFKVGTVSTGAPGTSAAITTTENAQGEQVVSFAIPRGDAGPSNVLTIGTVSSGSAGSSAAATITGTSPSQVLNLTIPQGAKGDKGDVGPTGPAGTNVARAPVASSVNPTSTYVNQWVRLAQIRLTSQYSDAVVELKLVGSGSGVGIPSAADIVWRVKQQNAMGGAPVGSVYVNNPLGGMTTADFAAVTEVNSATETIVGLYVRSKVSYDTLFFYERAISGVNYVTFYTNAAFVGTTLPAGAGTTFAGADNPTDIKLGTTSTTAAAGDHTHADLTNATNSATANTLVKRDGAGYAGFSKAGSSNQPTVASDLTRKDYVDTQVATRAASSHTHGITDLTATGTRDATTFLRGDNTWAVPPTGGGGTTVSDASTTAKGIIQLAGDLSGTAAAPTVPGLANKANSAITISAGTGLTGGGNLTANRTLAVSYGTTAGTAVQGNDVRVTADQVATTASIRTLGTGATQAAAGNHTHTAASISDSTTVGRSVLMAADASSARAAIGAGTSDLAIGTTATTAAAGNHTHTDLTNATINGTANTLAKRDNQGALFATAFLLNPGSTAQSTSTNSMTRKDYVDGQIATRLPNDSPFVRYAVTSGTTQSIAAGGAGSKIKFTTAQDTHADVVPNAAFDEFTLNRSGVWEISVSVRLSGFTGSGQTAIAYISDATASSTWNASTFQSSGTVFPDIQVVTKRRFTAGQVVSGYAFMSVAGSLDTTTATAARTNITFDWVKP